MAIALGAIFGLKIIVTCCSDEKCRRAEAIGAAHAINYKDQDFVAEVKRLTDGAGVNIVLDMVGSPYFEAALRALAWCGRLVVIGFAAGTIPSVRVNYLLLKNIEVSGLQVTD